MALVRTLEGRRTRRTGWLLSAAFLCLGHAAAAHTHHSASHAAAARHTHIASAGHHATHLASSHTRRGIAYAANAARLSGYAERHHHSAQYATLTGGLYVTAAPEYQHSGIQCVPYAREVSHIQLSGDAFLWWAEAAERYARGNAPEPGAVLNFRSVRRMPLGHVAVVTAIIDNRTILATQANWVHGAITNDVTMQDVSPNNDWSEVQVELGDTSTLGAPYPTYGFIYNRPAGSDVIASNAATGTEVAEAPRAITLATDAPDRNLQ